MARCLTAAAQFPTLSAPCGSLRQLLFTLSLLVLCCDISTTLPWYGDQVTVFVEDEQLQDDGDPNLAPAPIVFFDRRNTDPITSVIISPTSSAPSPVASSSVPSASATAKANPESNGGLPLRVRLALGLSLSLGLLGIFTSFYSLYMLIILRKKKVKHGQQNPLQDITNFFEPKRAKVYPPGLKLDHYIDHLNLLWISEISIWGRFLSIYGRQGIRLREMIMLVSALYFPFGEYCKCRHWSRSGKRDFSSPPNLAQFFLTLLKEASGPRELQAMEERLVHLGIITVKDAGQSEPSTCQDWVTDNRSWCAALDHDYNKTNSYETCRDLLVLYSQIPDRDVHMMAERYREMFYKHAHKAVLYVYQMTLQKVVILDDLEEIFYDLALQVFSQRYQQGDEEVIQFMKSRVSPNNLSHEWERLTERHFMLQLVELKATVSRHSSQIRSPRLQSLIQETIPFFYRAFRQQSHMSKKVWGMIGYALTDLMDTTEIAHNRDSFDQATQLTRAWCETALVSRTPIEMAALCCVIVRLRAFDKLENMPQETHLSCGCYLARAGFLNLAVFFLSSGIRHCEEILPKTLNWRYHLELMTVKMRLGQWKEAEHWLSVTWERLSARKDHVPADEFDLWKHSGELGEFRLNLASLLSDCYIARGCFVKARNMILSALGKISLMQDFFITSIRLTLKSRLLNLHLQLQGWYDAAETAIDLSRELQAYETFPLEWQKASWMVQEILACVDQLMHQELFVKVYNVLQSLRRISTDSPETPVANCRSSTGFLPENTITEIDQRWCEVKHILDSKDVRIRDRTLPLVESHQQIEAKSNEIESQPSDITPTISEMAQATKDYGYTFPDPISTADIIMTQEEEDQRPGTPPPVRVENENPQVDMARSWQPVRAKRALNLSRHRKNISRLLRLPKPPRTGIPPDSTLPEIELSELPPSSTVPMIESS